MTGKRIHTFERVRRGIEAELKKTFSGTGGRLECPRSDDALATLLKQTVFFRPLRDGTASPTQGQLDDFENLARAKGAMSLAKWLAARGVVVLPPDHPLRTGEPSEAAVHIAARELVRCMTAPTIGDPWMSLGENQRQTYLGWAREMVRAALAVLREPL